MQYTLDRVQEFMKSRELRLNPLKCQMIGFASTNISREQYHDETEYFINNTAIPRDANPKYLGVILDHNMDWHKLIESTVKKLKHRLTLMRRLTSPTRGAKTMQTHGSDIQELLQTSD